LGALEWVVREAENELARLDAQAEKLLEDEGPESPVLLDLYEVSYPRYLTCTRLTFHSTWTSLILQPSKPVLRLS
jgi:hypothetical protein